MDKKTKMEKLKLNERNTSNIRVEVIYSKSEKTIEECMLKILKQKMET